MWIEEVAPERVAELFHNYEHALRVFGKGSESGSWEEWEHPREARWQLPRTQSFNHMNPASILPSQVEPSGAAKF
jgi:hypothetical protein